MEPEEQSPHQTSRIFALVGISIVILVVAVMSIISFARRRVLIQRTTPMKIEEKKDVAVSPSITPALAGRVGVKVKGSQSTVRRGQNVTVFVYADSQGQQVTGFDAVLRYNHNKLRFESVKSVLDGLEVYETEEEIAADSTELIVTGIQSLRLREPFVLSNTALVEVTFTVLGSGTIPIELAYEPGSERETNLITTLNEDIVNSVVNTEIKAL